MEPEYGRLEHVFSTRRKKVADQVERGMNSQGMRRRCRHRSYTESAAVSRLSNAEYAFLGLWIEIRQIVGQMILNCERSQRNPGAAFIMQEYRGANAHHGHVRSRLAL